MQEKQDQKVVLVSLSIYINIEHEEHTKKKKNQNQPTQITEQYNIDEIHKSNGKPYRALLIEEAQYDMQQW